MQSLYGPFCSIYGYGDGAFKVDQKITEAIIETADNDANNSNHLFDLLLLFDRFLDVYSVSWFGFLKNFLTDKHLGPSNGWVIFDCFYWLYWLTFSSDPSDLHKSYTSDSLAQVTDYKSVNIFLESSLYRSAQSDFFGIRPDRELSLII